MKDFLGIVTSFKKQPAEPIGFWWALAVLTGAAAALQELENSGYYAAREFLDAASRAEFVGRAGLFLAVVVAFLYGRRSGLAEGFRWGRFFERDGGPEAGSE